MNGIDLGAVYYPGASWIGADGDILAEYGTFLNHSSKFTSYMGGARFRWQAPRGIELWAHGLAGFAKFLPQTALGGQTAFSYEAGGGMDLGAYRRPPCLPDRGRCGRDSLLPRESSEPQDFSRCRLQVLTEEFQHHHHRISRTSIPAAAISRPKYPSVSRTPNAHAAPKYAIPYGTSTRMAMRIAE